MGCCSSRPPVTVTRRSGGPQHIPITANEWNNSNETEGRNVEVERTHNSIESGEVTLLEPSLSSSPTPAPSSSSSTTSANSPPPPPPPPSTPTREKIPSAFTKLFRGTPKSPKSEESAATNTTPVDPNMFQNIHPLMAIPPQNADFAHLEAVLSQVGAIECINPKNGNRPIHIACQFGYLKYLSLLIDKGCDLNAQNNEGNTPLHLAIGKNHFECALALKTAGANETITNAAGHEACTGIDGNNSYGTAAILSAINAKQLEIALRICDYGEVKLETFKKAVETVKPILKDQWLLEHEERYKDILYKYGEEVDSGFSFFNPHSLISAFTCQLV